MRIAITADWHLRGKDLDAAREQLAALVMGCVEREVRMVCVAGDVFDRPSIGDNYASTGAVAEVGIRAVAELTKHGIEVLMIPGNHDMSGAGSADALHVFDGMPLVNIDRKPGVVDCGSLDIVAIPWSWTGEDPEMVIRNTVGDSRQGIKQLLLAHVQVTGGRMNGSFTCESKPGKWQVSRKFLSTLPVSHIALGDFHARQDAAGKKGGYVGALRQLNFGEEDNQAGFEVWDSETGITEWVELEAAPTYRTVKVQTPEDMLFLGGIRPNEHLKVRATGDVDMSEVKRIEAQGVTVEQVVDREERVRRADVPEGILDKPHDMIRLWAGIQDPPINDYRKAQMLALYDGVFGDRTERGEISPPKAPDPEPAQTPDPEPERAGEYALASQSAKIEGSAD
ncbi:metallophosphoesterase [bacterium]|nr:metallophosphoesterase [bacterium]